jgi:hypothetical protein
MMMDGLEYGHLVANDSIVVSARGDSLGPPPNFGDEITQLRRLMDRFQPARSMAQDQMIAGVSKRIARRSRMAHTDRS